MEIIEYIDGHTFKFDTTTKQLIIGESIVIIKNIEALKGMLEFLNNNNLL